MPPPRKEPEPPPSREEEVTRLANLVVYVPNRKEAVEVAYQNVERHTGEPEVARALERLRSLEPHTWDKLMESDRFRRIAMDNHVVRRGWQGRVMEGYRRIKVAAAETTQVDCSPPDEREALAVGETSALDHARAEVEKNKRSWWCGVGIQLGLEVRGHKIDEIKLGAAETKIKGKNVGPAIVDPKSGEIVGGRVGGVAVGKDGLVTAGGELERRGVKGKAEAAVEVARTVRAISASAVEEVHAVAARIGLGKMHGEGGPAESDPSKR